MLKYLCSFDQLWVQWLTNKTYFTITKVMTRFEAFLFGIVCLCLKNSVRKTDVYILLLTKTKIQL